jgi:oligopeptide transport system ATP-binding protein
MLAIEREGLMENLLEVKNVKKYFPIYDRGVLFKKYRMLKAVDGVSFLVRKGECFGIAGESGSGKTTVAKLILLLEKITEGKILFEGKNLGRLIKRDRSWYRRRVQTIFQDAASSLNPRMRILDIVSEPMEVQPSGKQSKNVIRHRTEEILHLVGLGNATLKKYPHELSGGQKQRVAIARAMILEPSLVILDEPVSALDVSIRAQILNLLTEIQEKQRITYLLIAHDLAMLQNISDQIAVMYLGKIVEMGNTEEVFDRPMHPYTKALFEAVPRPEPGRAKEVPAISGEIGNPIHPPSGCRFHPRCKEIVPECRENEPVVRNIGKNHQVACHLLTRR